jgi:hypothetical protein
MDAWNPWRVTALAMALVMAAALVTGLVVANWSSSTQEVASPPTRLIQQPRPAGVRGARLSSPTVPTQEVVNACNRYASTQVGGSDKPTEVGKNAAIGGVVGVAAGPAGGTVEGGGEGAGAAIGGVVGASGVTLYGLNENKKNDQKYRAAYSGCLRSHGYTG